MKKLFAIITFIVLGLFVYGVPTGYPEFESLTKDVDYYILTNSDGTEHLVSFLEPVSYSSVKQGTNGATIITICFIEKGILDTIIVEMSTYKETKNISVKNIIWIRFDKEQHYTNYEFIGYSTGKIDKDTVIVEILDTITITDTVEILDTSITIEIQDTDFNTITTLTNTDYGSFTENELYVYGNYLYTPLNSELYGIFNTSGVKVSNDVYNTEIDISYLSSGIYIAVVKVDNEYISLKFKK